MTIQVRRRVKLRFTGKVQVTFVDREVALRKIHDLAEKGEIINPVVVYGPKGCGKTALLRQTIYLLEDLGYDVLYVNPTSNLTEETLYCSQKISNLVQEILKLVPEPYSRLVDTVLKAAGYILKKLSKPRLAVLLDDIFQAIGLDKAELYIKALLNLMEYPPGEYESIFVLVTSSEGLTRARIGRHRWARIMLLWNLTKEGLRKLYEQIPGQKPDLEQVWKFTGGNPWLLRDLYMFNWNYDTTLKNLIQSRNMDAFINSIRGNREILDTLRDIVNDPDTIVKEYHREEVRNLEEELVKLNLMIEVWPRENIFWLDTPPPERDPELGIGTRYAWQTPAHREAVRILIERC